MRRINTLQAGRALAALAVVVHHAALAAEDFAGPLPGFGFLSSGFLGVDFFFTLSGFIIYHSTAGRNRTLSNYAKARARRVLVPYFPVGLAVALLYTFRPSEHVWSWLPTITLLPVNSAPALSVAWTLQHEMLFYAVFALLFFSRLLWLGLGIWTIAILLGPHEGIPLALINLEFIAGVLAAKAYRKHVDSVLLICGFLAFLSAWIMLGAERDWSVLFGLALACLLPVITSAERQYRFEVPRPLVFLGAASYSIYLCHGLAISVIARVPGIGAVPLFILAAIVGTLGGIVYYLIVEKPALRIRGIGRNARRTAEAPC